MLFSKSKPAPSPSQAGTWPKWTPDDLFSKLEDGSIIACLSGLNRRGDLQHIFMPTTFSNVQQEKDIIGNMYDTKGDFALLQTQGSEFGYGLVVEEFSNIPTELRPSKPLPKKSLEGSPWEKSSVDLGIVACPMVIPFFFGQEIVQGNICDDDFKLKMQAVSPDHANWASLITEAFDQYEHSSIIETIVEKKLGKKPADFITPALDPDSISESFPYYFVAPFFNREQAANEQQRIAAFFKVSGQPNVANPFPTTQPTGQTQFQQQLQQQSQQWTQFLALQQQAMIANQN